MGKLKKPMILVNQKPLAIFFFNEVKHRKTFRNLTNNVCQRFFFLVGNPKTQIFTFWEQFVKQY
jgi:hypothetical protein